MLGMTTLMNEMCSANDVDVSSSKRKRIDQNNALSRHVITTEQKSKLRNSIKELIVQDIYKEDNHKTNRLLQERGWDFINEFLETFEFEVPVDQTINVAGIEFVLGSIACDNFAIDDIETTGSGVSSEYELSFLVNGITLTCQFDYRCVLVNVLATTLPRNEYHGTFFHIAHFNSPKPPIPHLYF
jgi:uncharacterized protein YprB with RNaseH-like and TPR domain